MRVCSCLLFSLLPRVLVFSCSRVSSSFSWSFFLLLVVVVVVVVGVVVVVVVVGVVVVVDDDDSFLFSCSLVLLIFALFIWSVVSLSLSLSVSLSLSLFLSSVSLSSCLSLCLSVCLSFLLSVFLPLLHLTSSPSYYRGGLASVRAGLGRSTRMLARVYASS